MMKSEAAGSRRSFLKIAGAGAAATGVLGGYSARATTESNATGPGHAFNVRKFGAKGDGVTLDTSAINNAIAAAAIAGGGTVFFPAGTYASYSIHLKSFVSLYLEPGATILAASTPLEGTTNGGYDSAEPQGGLGALPGLRAQPLAQQPNLGRRHS